MSRFLDLARQAEFRREQRTRAHTSEPAPTAWDAASRQFRVVAVTSNKGGVGKTTVAVNLAVYLRSLRPNLPVLLFGFDDQTSLDRVISFDPETRGPNVADAIRAGSFREAIRLGRHSVHFVPSSREIAKLKQEIAGPFCLQRALLRSGWRGLVLVDTKSDFEILTLNALAASDLALVMVADQASLHEAGRVFEQLEAWQRPRDRARILLSLVDLRVKFRHGDKRDVLSLLVSEIRSKRYPLLETFVSRSPKVESLQTNPEGRATTILKAARGSLVHRQMTHLANSVLEILELERRTGSDPSPNAAEAPGDAAQPAPPPA